MNKAERIDYYIDKCNNPNFQIDQIHRELEAKNVPDEEIRDVVRIVDGAVQRRALTKSTNSRGAELAVAGVVLTVVGAGITLGTYMGLIEMGDSFLIVYGPFFGGVSLLVTGLAQRRK